MVKKAKVSGQTGTATEKKSQKSGSQTNSTVAVKSLAKSKWRRVLILASRGIGSRQRHLIMDLKKMMPHHKSDAKLEKNKNLSVINEICEMKNCDKAMFFESRRKSDLFLWMSNAPHGPSVKFLVENIHTMDELKFTGNCLRGSRPILSFSPEFETNVSFQVTKEIISQVFGVPRNYPRSQPFVDKVFHFSIVDNKIWFRCYQILSKEGAQVEIGPRFVLNPIKIFAGSFGGETIWTNRHFITPAMVRRTSREQSRNGNRAAV